VVLADGALKVAAGGLLAFGRFPRLSALALAGSLIQNLRRERYEIIAEQPNRDDLDLGEAPTRRRSVARHLPTRRRPRCCVVGPHEGVAGRGWATPGPYEDRPHQ
jgi:hypothetical protein